MAAAGLAAAAMAAADAVVVAMEAADAAAGSAEEAGAAAAGSVEEGGEGAWRWWCLGSSMTHDYKQRWTRGRAKETFEFLVKFL